MFGEKTQSRNLRPGRRDVGCTSTERPSRGHQIFEWPVRAVHACVWCVPRTARISISDAIGPVGAQVIIFTQRLFGGFRPHSRVRCDISDFDIPILRQVTCFNTKSLFKIILTVSHNKLLHLTLTTLLELM